MTSASEPGTVEIAGGGGRVFAEVEDWAKLPAGWTFCDVPGVAVDSQERVYLFTRW